MKIVLIIFAVLTTAVQSDFISDEGITARVKHGARMTIKELEKFNYQVGILTTYPDEKVGICGGALVAPDVILTAAHCVYNCKYVDVFMGGTTRLNKGEKGTTRINKDKIVWHEKYSSDFSIGAHHDIAIIILPQSVTLDKLVGTIPLASSKTFDCEDKSAKAWVSGWGEFGETTLKTKPSVFDLTQMRYAAAIPITNKECKVIFQDLIYKKPTQLCSSGKNKAGGVCKGDSGGPYAFENPKDSSGKRILCGINSFGPKDSCEEETPNGYISVSYFNDNGWICENSGGKVGCSLEATNASPIEKLLKIFGLRH